MDGIIGLVINFCVVLLVLGYFYRGFVNVNFVLNFCICSDSDSIFEFVVYVVVVKYKFFGWLRDFLVF